MDLADGARPVEVFCGIGKLRRPTCCGSCRVLHKNPLQILKFQPVSSMMHLPPTAEGNHGTRYLLDLRGVDRPTLTGQLSDSPAGPAM